MANNKIRLRIITPSKMLFDGDVEIAVIQASEGQIGVMYGHAPLTTTLGYGALRAVNGDDEQIFSVFGGFVEVTPNRITVMSDIAELPGEIDTKRAEMAKERAERRLREISGSTDVKRAQLALRRALVRIDVSHYNNSDRHKAN